MRITKTLAPTDSVNEREAKRLVTNVLVALTEQEIHGESRLNTVTQDDTTYWTVELNVPIDSYTKAAQILEQFQSPAHSTWEQF